MIAGRFLGKYFWYVSHLPGEGGKDWGYHLDLKQARELSDYWAKRLKNSFKDVYLFADKGKIC